MEFKSLSPFGSFQKTLRTSCVCEGVGAHSGQPVTLKLKPAPENSGIVFHRVDQGEGVPFLIPARLKSVVNTRMSTTLGNAYGVTIATVEHLMAAFYACEVDNCVVEVHGSEVPIMDGSSEPFMDLIEAVGVVSQNSPRSYVRVLETLEVSDDHGKIRLKPSDFPVYKATVDFKGRADFGLQTMVYDGTPETFRKEISKARTFGFLEDAQKIWSLGLAKGSSLDNTVVIQGNDVLNEEGLRFRDEFVRHKILDAVGDFYTSGFPILGEFEAVNCGHALNHKMMEKLFSSCHSWEVVTPPCHAQIEGMFVGIYPSAPSLGHVRA